MAKKCIALIGSASNSLPVGQQSLAFDVGQAIVESGCRIINGGMGGVMEHSARGAHTASNYQNGDVIGILPSYIAGDANPYIDISLPTGLGVARNAVLMAACDAVIALDGGAGTLSELALAWQMKKPIACIGDEGWHTRLQTLSIDSRRVDVVSVLKSVSDIHGFVADLFSHGGDDYEGISKSKLSFDTATKYLLGRFVETRGVGSFKFLGSGLEGVVVENSGRVYKVFNPTDYDALLMSNLSKLANDLACRPSLSSGLPPFEFFSGELIVIRYYYFISSPLKAITLDLFVPFLKYIKELGWCMVNIKSENFCVTKSGDLICIDIGRDVVPFTDSLFYSGCQRAFLTVLFNDHPNLENFYRYTNNHDDFDLVANTAGVYYSCRQLTEIFLKFYEEILGEV